MAQPQIGLQSPVQFHKVLFSEQSYIYILIIYINDIDVGLNSFFSKFTDDAKIGNPIITVDDRINLQEDLKISEWSQTWEMPFNVNKCHILQVGT